MNKTIVWLAILSLPLLSFGQVNLCHKCALTINDCHYPDHCCESCLQNYYIRQLQKNILHGKLSPYYDYETFSKLTLLPDTLSAHFLVTGVKTTEGYSLISSELCESTFFLINLMCEDSAGIRPGTEIILITNNSSAFREGESYYLTIHPYFKYNQSFRIYDGKVYSVVRGAGTLFDLVYKEWLIVMLPVGRNYFFLIDKETTSKH